MVMSDFQEKTLLVAGLTIHQWMEQRVKGDLDLTLKG